MSVFNNNKTDHTRALAFLDPSGGQGIQRFDTLKYRQFDKLTDIGEDIGMVDGKVVDRYEYDKAQRTLQWAAACAAKDAYKARAMARTNA